MPSIIEASDFSGIYAISQQNMTTVELDAYISHTEADYLIPLFGAELYALFIADLNPGGTPSTQRFADVFNAFVEDAGNGSLSTFYVGSPFAPYFPFGEPDKKRPSYYQSYGIPDMLLGFLFFGFMRNQTVKATPAGLRSPDQDVSKNAGFSDRLTQAQNRAIQSYQAIQWYMSQGPNKADYPEYKGVAKRYSFMGGAI